ncbi:lipopolysaccharide biosynthesis protein [Oceanirhabdus sp. W0125-5]|uniref:lipopolysaccharide biosynthesis protein n=1 Tax=Oceanirhabdus sp. W0125-5 TaxID=2999116 RepID=UPI0022F2AD2B|nr:oligosaccharide flippase family protein [Oceanirhabdus sp. W0125-5]WBW98960.1 oligosaccharide flippase family protein [Oceanirhabdus sp. W0125-5]
MRVKNSLINITAGIVNQIIITLLSFISRSVFISSLGIAYLGVNGLFTNILAMLALAESGIGSSIIYSLYKPVAEKNEEKINVLIKLYKNAYRIISLIILFFGLAIIPFLKYFIKDSNVENINLIFILFLINTISPYFFSHKISFLNVCQKNYIVTAVYSVTSIITTCLKIGILYFTKNYILYLIIEVCINIITGISLSKIINKLYPFLKNKVSSKLDSETKRNIIKNVKAIVVHNIGGYFVFGTDNIIISSFVGITAVGLYSNYNMLINICRTFINQVPNNIYHSIGNLVAKESKDKVYNIFKTVMFMNFWLYSLFGIFLYNIIDPLITLWLGSDFIMSKSVLIILLLIFYERGMRNSISMVKTTAGIFYEDRYASLVRAVINLSISITLVQFLGITGVFIGTLISAIAVPFWITPLLVYKKIFKKSVVNYFIKYGYYAIVTISTCFITSILCSFISVNGFLKLIMIGFTSLLTPNIIFILIFHKTDEFEYLMGIAQNIILKRFNLGKRLNNIKSYITTKNLK